MKWLFFLITFLLLAGCTMQEAEINEVLQKIKEMGESLDQLEGLAKEEEWEHFKQNVYLANESLTHVNQAIDEAESRGEDAEFVQRVRTDYLYLSKQFDALIISANIVQNLEKAKPLMEELERTHASSINPALELLNQVLEDIEKYSKTVDDIQTASKKMIDYDKEMLKVDSAIGKMQKTRTEFEKRKSNFASLRDRLVSLKEKMGL